MKKNAFVWSEEAQSVFLNLEGAVGILDLIMNVEYQKASSVSLDVSVLDITTLQDFLSFWLWKVKVLSFSMRSLHTSRSTYMLKEFIHDLTPCDAEEIDRQRLNVKPTRGGVLAFKMMKSMSTYQGTNLLAVGMDGNNQIIPIATDVSQGETGPLWTWFLSKLKECIGEVPNLSIISDRHATTKSACQAIFPNAFYGYCCRHLLMSCKLKSIRLQCLFWKMCKAYSPEDFNMEINKLGRKRPDVYQNLTEAGVKKWSRAYCPSDRYNYMTSNSTELINSLTRDVRKMSITNLIEWYRDLVQRWYYERQKNFRVVKPPLMDKKPAGRPKSTTRIISQGEELVPVRCGRCDTRGHNRNSCRETIPQKKAKTRYSQQEHYYSELEHYYSQQEMPFSFKVIDLNDP
nr:transposase, MuDR, MULE transposase domain protein [Tanacetum cinerariifolium]